jgi:hypothetical protein
LISGSSVAELDFDDRAAIKAARLDAAPTSPEMAKPVAVA